MPGHANYLKMLLGMYDTLYSCFCHVRDAYICESCLPLFNIMMAMISIIDAETITSVLVTYMTM
jgi:hypothetical protein